MRPHTLQDNATPSGNSVAADVLLTLGELTGRTQLAERAGSIVESIADLMTEHPGAFSRYLAVAERLYGVPYTLVISGDPSTGLHRAMTRHALQHPQPALVVAHAPTEADADVTNRFPVFLDRTAVDGGSAAWLCRQGSCMLPATSIDDLMERLREMDRALATQAPA